MTYSKLFNIYLAIFAAVFSVSPKLTVLLIIGLVPLIVVGYVKKELVISFYRTHFYLILLYLLYLTWIVFSNHVDIGLKYAENKLSFLLFPILLSFQPRFKIQLSNLILGSALGLVVAAVIGFVASFQCVQDGGTLSTCLTSVHVSPIHHPSYFAAFILINLVGIWIMYKRKEAYFNLRWIVPYFAFIGAVFMLCLSLASLLFLALTVIVVALYLLKKRIKKIAFYTLVILAPIVFYAVFSNLPFVKADVEYTQHSIGKFVQNPIEFIQEKQGYKTGNEVRLIMWTASCYEIMEHPLGVGTGNVDDYLSKRLVALHQLELAKMDENHSIKYNPHNQFLQTALEIGILGLIFLVLFISSAIRDALRTKNYLLLFICSSLVFNSLFESMLQRQSGIVYFAFWMCILLVIDRQQNTTFNEK